MRFGEGGAGGLATCSGHSEQGPGPTLRNTAPLDDSVSARMMIHLEHDIDLLQASHHDGVYYHRCMTLGAAFGDDDALSVYHDSQCLCTRWRGIRRSLAEALRREESPRPLGPWRIDHCSRVCFLLLLCPGVPSGKDPGMLS